MPKVIQYEPDQVRTSTVKGPRASASSLNLKPLSQGISNLAEGFIGMQNRIDTTSAEEALNGFEKAKNDILFNPDNGYYNTQGRNSYDNAQGTSQKIEKLKLQFGEGLNEQSRQMFNEVADKHVARSNVDILKHSSKGLRAWEVATIETQVENTIENAVLYWNNPTDLKVQRILGEQAILDSAKLTGIGPEATAEKLQTYRSKFISGAISAATAQSSEEGEKLLNESKKMLEGPDKLKLEKSIEVKKKAEKTRVDAAQATLTATNLVSDYDSRKDIQAEVNKIKDAELRKKTMTEAMTLFDQKKKAESEEQGDIFENAERMIMEGGTASMFQTANPEAWGKLSPSQQKKLTSDTFVETDWNTYSELMTMPKEQLSKVNPVDYFDKLGKTERKSLISAVKTARGAGSGNEKVDSQVGRTRAAQVKSAVNQIFGYETESEKSDKDRKRIDSFYTLLDSEVRYREDVKGSKLTSAEFTNVLAGFTREVVQKKDLFGIDIFWADKTSKFDDIPTEDIDELVQNLRSKNKAVTTGNLINLHEQVKKNKR